jgi:hypothetical protein
VRSGGPWASVIVAIAALACAPANTVLPGSSSAPESSPSPASSPTTPFSTTASPTRAVVQSGARQLPEAEAERLVGGRVRQALDALKRRDAVALSAMVHPAKGVRFSPYPYVRPAEDQRLASNELATAFQSGATRIWGRYDGRGDPIELTLAAYVDQFVYGRDFATSTQVAYNRAIGSGNTIDNTPDLYPDAIMFEAYDPGPDPQFRDTRWQCLRLLFEREGQQWYLVGIVHGEWTI